MGNEGRAARKEGLLAVVKNTAGPRRAARCYFDGGGVCAGGGCGGGGDGGCGPVVHSWRR